jgi:hypothetical protein
MQSPSGPPRLRRPGHIVLLLFVVVMKVTKVLTLFLCFHYTFREEDIHDSCHFQHEVFEHEECYEQ